MKSKFGLVPLFALFFAFAYGQANPIKPLKIGDKVPDILLENIIRNYPSQKAKLSDFKGKLLILDFWSINCSPCIAGFPTLEKFQNEFGNKIQVLLITNNTPSQVSLLLNKSTIAKECKLPFIINNLNLYKLFPHTSEPFQVWIDARGFVQAITSSYNTSSENIAAFLSTGQIKLPVRDDCVDWDDERYKSLLQEGNGRELKYLQASSFFMSYIPCIRISEEGVIIDSFSGKTIGLKILNAQLTALYQRAYYRPIPDFARYPDDRIIIEAANAEEIRQPKDESKLEEWKRKFFFSYELRIPSAINWPYSEDSLNRTFEKIMREDLDRYFLKASQERRTLKCRVLVRTSSENKLETFKIPRGKGVLEKTKNGIVARNIPFKNFSGTIGFDNQGINAPPFIDETGYTGFVDLNLNCSLTDIPELRKELSKYGLDIIEEERTIDVLVLKENNMF